MITDALPAGLTLLEASSDDGQVRIEGNTVVISVATLARGPSHRATVTARIDTLIEPGRVIENTAELTNPSGDDVTADDTLRVGGTSEAGISCFIRAQRYARPGRPIKYIVRFNKAGESNDVTLELPQGVLVGLEFPPAAEHDEDSITWHGVRGTSGLVKVHTVVAPEVLDGSVLTSVVTLTTDRGSIATCLHESVVERSKKLFASLKGNSHVKPGGALRYVGRYRETVGSNRATVTLPAGVTLESAQPDLTEQSDNVLTWRDLPNPAGLVKVRVAVPESLQGTSLDASITVTDASGGVVTDGHTTAVRSTSEVLPREPTAPVTGDAGPGDPPSSETPGLDLSLPRTVKVGLTAKITLRYDGLEGAGILQVALPQGLGVALTIPAADVVGGDGSVTWTGVVAPKGTVQLRVLVSESAASGSRLPIAASLTGGSGSTQTAAGEITVR